MRSSSTKGGRGRRTGKCVLEIDYKKLEELWGKRLGASRNEPAALCAAIRTFLLGSRVTCP